MLERIEHSSYDLIRNLDGTWTVYASKEPQFRASFILVIKYMIKKMGFEYDEVEFAVEEIDKNDHSHAHFGMYKRFIYSTDVETKIGVA